ncbi:MAG: DUF503 domain-containing protein [Chloroflexi bacterium]|nr:DUF503 domain-containing protein [Chloroflexota bacterium]
MNVGVCRIQIRLPENGTLKGKRQVVQSLASHLRSRFNISVAEVEDNEHHQLLTLGVSCVSNDSRHANQVLSQVVAYVERTRRDVELLDYSLEIIRGA